MPPPRSTPHVTPDAENGDDARGRALRASVREALALQGIVLPPDALARVEEQFARIGAIAAAFVELPLADDAEPACRFRA
ncbi:MAG TPA: DUF4089 domain-containing protein [Burkholderiaceae bacterium]|nr:DUF4089 domain-containing protein [Burkholderiaceae bacterium]